MDATNKNIDIAEESESATSSAIKKTRTERFIDAWDRLKDVEREHGNGGRFTPWMYPHDYNEGEFCGSIHEFAIIRIKGRIREFCLVEAAPGLAWPVTGARVKFEDGKLEAINRDVLVPRPGRCGYVYSVARNRAMVAKAVEMGREFDLNIRTINNSELSRYQALAELERANSCASARSGKFRTFQATYYASASTWRISSYAGSMEFIAPAPEEIVAMINTQNSCEKERRALGRMGRRIKEETAEAPVRRVSRL